MSLLVSDYDGTFHTGERSISINCNTIRKYLEDGNFFMLSSGRPLDSLKEQIEQYNIPFTHLACSDGNFLFDKNGKLMSAHTMPHDIIEKLDRLFHLNIYQGIQFAYPEENGHSFDKMRPLGSIAFVIREENISNLFLSEYNKLKSENPNYRFDVYGYNRVYYYMIRPNGISKSSPVMYLERKLDIPKSEIYTIGDNDNDFEMIADYNGFMIGDNISLKDVSLGEYQEVYELVNDIKSNKVLKR